MTARDLIRSEIDRRRQRGRFLEASIFGEPAWDILLDLALAHIDGRHVSISSACRAGETAPSTGLRHVNVLVERGLLLRECNPNDRRSVWLVITDEAFAAVLASVGASQEALAA